MADEITGKKLAPEVAQHLAEAMKAPDMPGAAAPISPMGAGGPSIWPEGSGKRRHPKERGSGHGRMGEAAAVTAVHRTSRPQMPHSS
ncbi:hypothetical protein FBY31_3255 [Arthrobacter sp. SLBN-100]|uniref:hypothetical protein n=1 Tax=Arthrobacter sp. SLBN-100 TaxID=2768450 RepID=UPI00114F9C83|nr:hypothetical protein [Arthrobacter sp. SLBN-100]TQJ69127.1 hypothetical protein FBY31_3255 [Arthrobacter sp. SLBN-100]